MACGANVVVVCNWVERHEWSLKRKILYRVQVFQPSWKQLCRNSVRKFPFCSQCTKRGPQKSAWMSPNLLPCLDNAIGCASDECCGQDEQCGVSKLSVSSQISLSWSFGSTAVTAIEAKHVSGFCTLARSECSHLDHGSPRLRWPHKRTHSRRTCKAKENSGSA